LFYNDLRENTATLVVAVVEIPNLTIRHFPILVGKIEKSTKKKI